MYRECLGASNAAHFWKDRFHTNLEFWAFFLLAAFSRNPAQRTKPCAWERRCIHSWQKLLYGRKILSEIPGSHLCSPLPRGANQASQFQPSTTKLWLPEDSMAQLQCGSYFQLNISFSAGEGGEWLGLTKARFSRLNVTSEMPTPEYKGSEMAGVESREFISSNSFPPWPGGNHQAFLSFICLLSLTGMMAQSHWGEKFCESSRASQPLWLLLGGDILSVTGLFILHEFPQ